MLAWKVLERVSGVLWKFLLSFRELETVRLVRACLFNGKLMTVSAPSQSAIGVKFEYFVITGNTYLNGGLSEKCLIHRHPSG